MEDVDEEDAEEEDTEEDTGQGTEQDTDYTAEYTAEYTDEDAGLGTEQDTEYNEDEEDDELMDLDEMTIATDVTPYTDPPDTRMICGRCNIKRTYSSILLRPFCVVSNC